LDCKTVNYISLAKKEIKMKTLKTFFTMIIMLTVSLSAQDKISTIETNLYNSKTIQFHSTIVNDDYQLLVSLPDSYDESEKKYPVIFVLDGDVAFGMATSIARYLQVGNSIPELIVVGIGYGSLSKDEGNKRARDYSPAKSGGAESFFNFMRSELFPFIDSVYRTMPDDRTISGYSLGATFALYALFTAPDTFRRYIVGSPHLAAGNFAIYNYEESASEKFGEINANVFISVGSEESEQKYFDPIDEMVTKIQSRDYTGLKLETKVFDGGTHLICPPETITYGLVSVFGK